MKYPISMYQDFEMPDPKEYIKNYSKKLIKIRKSHKCIICKNESDKGEYMLREKGFVDGQPVSLYLCIDCLDDYIDMLELDNKELKEVWMSREETIRHLERLFIGANDKVLREAITIAIHDVQVADVMCGTSKGANY